MKERRATLTLSDGSKVHGTFVAPDPFPRRIVLVANGKPQQPVTQFIPDPRRTI